MKYSLLILVLFCTIQQSLFAQNLFRDNLFVEIGANYSSVTNSGNEDPDFSPSFGVNTHIGFHYKKNKLKFSSGLILNTLKSTFISPYFSYPQDPSSPFPWDQQFTANIALTSVDIGISNRIFFPIQKDKILLGVGISGVKSFYSQQITEKPETQS